MATTANYTIDNTGGMTSNGAPGMASLGALAPTPTTSDPYTKFNSALTSMLVTAQNQNTNNNTLLTGAKDQLTNMSVAPNGPQPFNPQASSASQVGAQSTLQSSFNPAITSISDQEANTAAAMTGIEGNISAIQAATQPIVLQPGQSLVSRDGTVIQQGHSYTPQINPLTGLMDGFDQNTGTWASGDSTNATITPPPSSNSTPVGGVDFSGAATGTKPYATDPNYASEVDSMYTAIKKVAPIPTAQTIDSFIQSQVGGKGAVTGQMIMSAATQYQVDPNLLAAVLGHESDFGTAGAAVKTMNAGNVGNTGTSTQTFASWQQGVNAAALAIAKRMPGNPNAGTPPVQNNPGTTGTSNVGGTFSPAAQAKVAQLPQSMQQYADAGPLGVAYINEDKISKLDPQLQASIQTLAGKAGIPTATSADVSGIKSIQSVLSNLDSMQALAVKTLGSGTLGHLLDMTVGPAAKFLQTGWGQNLGLFDNYRDTAIKAVQALAGGAGSGLRINGAEIAANTQNLPQSGDSVQNAVKDIQQLRQMIYINLANSFPYATAPVTSPTGQTGSMPIGNLAQALATGYTVQ